MADPGQRVPLNPAEVRAKARDAINRAKRSIDELNDEDNAERIITHAFHDGATAVELFKAARELGS